jgi:MFS family permease
MGIALVPPNAFWLLLLLRGVQAAGSASTIALGEYSYFVNLHESSLRCLGAGVIGDISVPSERSGFYGIYSLGPMVSPLDPCS